MKTPKPILILTTLLLLLFSCTKKSIGTSSNNTAPNLAGTKWCIYQYKDATTTSPQPRTDTLIFTDAGNYKYNNQNLTYALTTDYLCTHLTLNGTPFGDLAGTPPNNFIQNTEIINVPFSQLKAGGAQTFYLWMKKL